MGSRRQQAVSDALGDYMKEVVRDGEMKEASMVKQTIYIQMAQAESNRMYPGMNTIDTTIAPIPKVISWE